MSIPRDALVEVYGDAVREGKGAILAADRPRIDARRGYRIEASLNLENEMPQRGRLWDYLVVIANQIAKAVAVEVHPATAGEVKVLLEKRAAAQAELQTKNLSRLIAKNDWLWIASGKVYIRPTDPQYRVLVRSGLQGPTTRLVLGQAYLMRIRDRYNPL